MTMVGILTPLNGLECFTNTPRVLSGTIEVWNEHINDGLEYLADILTDVYRVADIPRDVGCFLIYP